MDYEEQVNWLYTNSAPILRSRVALEFMDVSGQERNKLLEASLSTPEVQRWLGNLRGARSIHGSTDTHVENALSKLLDSGFDRSVPAFAECAEHLFSLPLGLWDPFALFPFLLRAGYADCSRVKEWLAGRLEKLCHTARAGSYDFYLQPEEALKVPKAWRGKPIYRDEYGHMSGYSLPTCYDFYALSYCPPALRVDDYSLKSESIVSFLSDERFQSAPDAYGWDKTKRQCYAAGRVFLACVRPARLLLFLELGAPFSASRRSTWFREGLAELEKFRTARGTFCFPKKLLLEKYGCQIYSGTHMGLGEDRHSPLALELESTFRMLYIQKRVRDNT